MCFIISHTFSVADWSGLQAGHSSIRTLLTAKPHCCNTCKLWLGIVLLKEAGASMKKMLLGWQPMSLQNLYVPFGFKGPSQMCDFPNPCALTHTAQSQMLSFVLCVDNTQDGPFPFWPEHDVHDFQNNFKPRLVRPGWHGGEAPPHSSEVMG